MRGVTCVLSGMYTRQNLHNRSFYYTSDTPWLTVSLSASTIAFHCVIKHNSSTGWCFIVYYKISTHPERNKNHIGFFKQRRKWRNNSGENIFIKGKETVFIKLLIIEIYDGEMKVKKKTEHKICHVSCIPLWEWLVCIQMIAFQTRQKKK